ncbi:MAG TPA: VOC family protein [Thermomicrobiales bacterium]|nr:VOC family protein [Thermomicrobiales bacterium]
MQGIDHVVIAVRDLAIASNDYARLGFTVTPGGEHTGGVTHNALISFADGSYFELIAFKEPDRPQNHKWWATFARGEGTVDFALLSESVDFEGDRLKQAEIELDGPHDGGRLRPDGQHIAWRNLGLKSAGVPLPFMIEDVTTRELRVPAGAATEHALGVSGVAGLVLLVDDLDRATTPYETLLDTSGESSTSTIPGARRARRFGFGAYWIELVEPDPTVTDLTKHTKERGAGPYEIVLAGSTRNADPLPLDRTHGACIRFEDVETLTR